MAIIKSASTAMGRYMQKLEPEKLKVFADDVAKHMQAGNLPKKVTQLHHLGAGATQQADLVMHPEFGLSVRKFFHNEHGLKMTPHALKVKNEFLERISQNDVKSFAKLKGYENKGNPITQRTYVEFIPGVSPKSTAATVPIERRIKQWDKLEAAKKQAMKAHIEGKIGRVEMKDFERKVNDRQFHHAKMIRKYRDNPVMPPHVKDDIAKVERFGFGYPVEDVATTNMVGSKIVDADTPGAWFEQPGLFDFDMQTPKGRKLARIKDVFKDKNPTVEKFTPDSRPPMDIRPLVYTGAALAGTGIVGAAAWDIARTHKKAKSQVA